MHAAEALPTALHDAAGSRALDRAAIEIDGTPGIDLMRRAGAAAFAVLRERWPAVRRVAVLCGTGNNGGDGFVVARLAVEAGIEARVEVVGDPARMRGDAAIAWREWQAVAPAVPFAGPADVAVDALFGTGLDRPLEGPARVAVEALNAGAAPVLSLDIPSGLHADTGAVLGAAVRAAATVTFISLKPGLLTGAGPDHCGALRFAGLGVSSAARAVVPPVARRTDLDACGVRLGARSRSAHKGRFGHVLVIGGDHGHGGAVRLAAEAAARVGAGLVSVATRERHVAALLAGRPEAMVHAVDSAAELEPLLARATVVAIGPGLGQGGWGRALFDHVLTAWQGPMVVDADALNLLAPRPSRSDRWVLTPHPGEAARLLATGTAAVQHDRFAAAAGIVERHGGVAVLKGAGTLVVAEGEAPRVCSDGNPGMATGGMGDVLTGVVAALLAQGLAPAAAAELGVALHARAADVAAAGGERGLLASDLFAPLRQLVNA